MTPTIMMPVQPIANACHCRNLLLTMLLIARFHVPGTKASCSKTLANPNEEDSDCAIVEDTNTRGGAKGSGQDRSAKRPRQEDLPARERPQRERKPTTKAAGRHGRR